MIAKKLIILLIIVPSLLFAGCTNSNDTITKNKIDVRGLSLKISLITVSYDVYRVNYKNSAVFNEEEYRSCGDYGRNYYKWLKDTYLSMDSSMKRRLIRIYDNYIAWNYISKTISLDDDASIDDIVEKLKNQSDLGLSEMAKEDIDIFYNYFYKEYLNDFMVINNPLIERKVASVNTYLDKKGIDIFKFMEDKSGLKFKKDYTALFYYDLPPIGAMGFDEEDYKISTIHPGTDQKNLFSAPFHEYSHELFRNFTSDSEFTKIADKLRKDKSLSEGYDKVGKHGYDWVGWCEENLVEGFSKYLKYEYYGNKNKNITYVYDTEFYNYLIKQGFDSNRIELKEISIKFYESILDNNL